jgi:hypothetical protein
VKKSNHIVFTTINVPYVLRDLHLNLARHGWLDQVKVWVVGDRKTPPDTLKLCREVSASGMEVEYLDIPAQDAWGLRCPTFYQRIPYNNETRRNIGYLRALEEGCVRLISIDDDNFPTDLDFIGGHSVVGKVWDGSLLASDNGFHNLCSYLQLEPAREIYPRGYPFRLRGAAGAPKEVDGKSVTIGVNAGLWLKDPDVDATTWLNGKITGMAYEGPDLAVLDEGTWTPVNTQNTAVLRELIPAYLCIPMGWPVPGGQIQRYGDIWGGYFLQALITGTRYRVAFGKPVVEHRRNPHDYVDDLRFEFWGMILTDWLVDVLKGRFRPRERHITDRLRELADFLLGDAMHTLPAWCPEEMREFLRWTAGNLSAWAEACEIVSESNSLRIA